MKIDVVIPIHNQINNISRILDGLHEQNMSCSDVWFVFDRTPMLSEEMIDDINRKYGFMCHFIEFTPPTNALRSDGFFAGAARNAGIIESLGSGSDIIVMIDGDCVPQKDLIKGHYEACKLNIPVLSCGRRREKSTKWKDRREYMPHLYNAGFFVKDLIINDSTFLTDCSVVWSCNIAMNRIAIRRIINLNLRYYGVSNVFHPSFDGGWGGEDSFLGVEAWIAKIFILVNSTASVEHIDHPKVSTQNEFEHKKLFDSMVKDIRLKTSLSPLDLKFFST